MTTQRETPTPAVAAALGELRVALKRLYRWAGEPSTRQVAARTGKVISHQTVALMLRVERLPRWGQLELLVEALSGGGETGEVTLFRKLWVAVREAQDQHDGSDPVPAESEPAAERPGDDPPAEHASPVATVASSASGRLKASAINHEIVEPRDSTAGPAGEPFAAGTDQVIPNQHANSTFLDATTRATTFDPRRVAQFRTKMRPDVRRRLPRGLSAADFLREARLMIGDQLTRTGALLFGENPTAVIPTAVVQCAVFHGTGKEAAFDVLELVGTVPEQIAQARDFVARSTQRGSAPTVTGAATEPVYAYPMLAVREIVANAIVHRDYENRGVCVHVRIFADRLEVTNPGAWGGRPLPDGEDRTLDTLAGESQRPNFRLAHVVSWSRLVEGEGSGIPRAVADCIHNDAPAPKVHQADGLVTVTLYPRGKTTTPDRRPAAAGPLRILMLSANPYTTRRLALDEEARAISEKLGESPDRDSYELITLRAVRPDDLLQHLNKYRPRIVHFSAHGTRDGAIVLSAEDGSERLVTADALADLFRSVKDDIRIVVLNAAYSSIQARAISRHIDYVIGMRDAIEDRAAAVFAAAFYSALGFRRTVEQAFDQAIAAVKVHGLPGHEVPELIIRPAGDPRPDATPQQASRTHQGGE